MPRTFLVTVATDVSKPQFKNWKSSATLAGWEDSQVIVLGKNEKWGGWSWRCNKIVEFCKMLHPEDRMVLCDAYDLLVFGSPKEFTELFEKNNCDILFGIDYLCVKHTDAILKKSCTGSIANDRPVFINGGGVMGTMRHLRPAYAYIRDNHTDDQIGWHQYVTDQMYEMGTTICLDEKNEMILNMMFGNHKIRDGDQNKMYLKFLEMMFNPGITTSIIQGTDRPLLNNGSRPLMVHTPGMSADKGARYNYVGRRFLKDTFIVSGMTFVGWSAITYSTLGVMVILVVYFTCIRCAKRK